MSDVAQILGLAPPATASSLHSTPTAAAVASEIDKIKTGSTPTAAAAAAARAKLNKQKKLSGMQREVLELLESTHRVNHALYPAQSKLSLQQKWKQHTAPAVKWHRQPFRNPARAGLAGERHGSDSSDASSGLTLTHWTKAHLAPSDYVFARFNTAVDVMQYTTSEYDAVVAPAQQQQQDDAQQWTRDETDKLFQLCRTFDLRWIVIADRFASFGALSTTPHRSIEALKARYYDVTNRLVASRRSGGTTAATALDAVKHELLESGAQDASFVFDAAYETQRKQQLDAAFERSSADEQQLRVVSDALRATEQQLKRSATKVDAKKKKELAAVPFGPSPPHKLPRGVSLRSARMNRAFVATGTNATTVTQETPALSSKLHKKFELLLDELGVPARPMPTRATCESVERVRHDAVALLSLQKAVGAKQSELQLLRERYASVSGTTAAIAPAVRSTAVRRTDRQGDVGVAGTGASSYSGHPSTVATPTAGHGQGGKALKHTAEKAFRAATKRRGSTPSAPSKRLKKLQ